MAEHVATLHGFRVANSLMEKVVFLSENQIPNCEIGKFLKIHPSKVSRVLTAHRQSRRYTEQIGRPHILEPNILDGLTKFATKNAEQATSATVPECQFEVCPFFLFPSFFQTPFY